MNNHKLFNKSGVAGGFAARAEPLPYGVEFGLWVMMRDDVGIVPYEIE